MSLKALVCSTAWAFGIVLMSDISRADIYATSGALVLAPPYGTVASYTNTGVLINPTVAQNFQPYGPTAIAVAGSNLYVATGGGSNSYIGEYTTTGTVVNPQLITGVNTCFGLAVSGSTLFVSSFGNGTIGTYSLTGQPLNTSLISGFAYEVEGIAVSGSDLFEVNTGNNSIGEYTITGATVNASLINNLNYGPTQIVVVGSDLFVLNSGSGTVSEYTTSGAVVNPNLITGLSYTNHVATAIATDGTSLYIARPYAGGNEISEYSLTGAPINLGLILGEGGPIAVTPSPEPSALALLGIGVAGLIVRRRAEQTV